MIARSLVAASERESLEPSRRCAFDGSDED
jgi:hypothetical protein